MLMKIKMNNIFKQFLEQRKNYFLYYVMIRFVENLSYLNCNTFSNLTLEFLRGLL